jgi:hypothetical protein
MEDGAIEGQLLGHANGLSHGFVDFGLEFGNPVQILTTSAKKSAQLTTKHWLLGPRMGDEVIEGQWLWHADGLCHGFWLGVWQILSNFSQTT